MLFEIISKRIKKEIENRGVTVAVNETSAAGGARYEKNIVFNFAKGDGYRLPYKTSVAISDDKTRVYFIPNENGFTGYQHGSNNRIAFELRDEFLPFVGHYQSLKYDENEHLFYLCAYDKNVQRTPRKVFDLQGDTVTLKKEEYDRIMKLVKEFEE